MHAGVERNIANMHSESVFLIVKLASKNKNKRHTSESENKNKIINIFTKCTLGNSFTRLYIALKTW